MNEVEPRSVYKNPYIKPFQILLWFVTPFFTCPRKSPGLQVLWTAPLKLLNINSWANIVMYPIIVMQWLTMTCWQWLLTMAENRYIIPLLRYITMRDRRTRYALWKQKTGLVKLQRHKWTRVDDLVHYWLLTENANLWQPRYYLTTAGNRPIAWQPLTTALSPGTRWQPPYRLAPVGNRPIAWQPLITALSPGNPWQPPYFLVTPDNRPISW